MLLTHYCCTYTHYTSPLFQSHGPIAWVFTRNYSTLNLIAVHLLSPPPTQIDTVVTASSIQEQWLHLPNILPLTKLRHALPPSRNLVGTLEGKGEINKPKWASSYIQISDPGCLECLIFEAFFSFVLFWVWGEEKRRTAGGTRVLIVIRGEGR